MAPKIILIIALGIFESAEFRQTLENILKCPEASRLSNGNFLCVYIIRILNRNHCVKKTCLSENVSSNLAFHYGPLNTVYPSCGMVSG